MRSEFVAYAFLPAETRDKIELPALNATVEELAVFWDAMRLANTELVGASAQTMSADNQGEVL